MKSISFWAIEHKIAARLIIISIYILLNLLGLFTGDLLFLLNIELSPLFILIPVLFTITGFIIYPKKNRKCHYKNFYFLKKSSDLILITATFLFIVYAGNSLTSPQRTINNRVFGVSLPSQVIISKNIVSFSDTISSKTTVSKKVVRKNLRRQVKELRKKYKDTTKTEKTILIILAFILASWLFAGVAALGCSLSCSGSEAAAAFVFFIGIPAIIFGLIKVIRRIKRGPKSQKVVPESND